MMSAARDEPIDPEDVAEGDWAGAVRTISGFQAALDEIHDDNQRLKRENFRLLAEKAALAAPQRWLPLKRAAGEIGEPYENVRKWAELGKIVAQKRGWGRGNWYVEMSSLHAYAAAKRGK
jgi:hypothetical protein